MLWSPRGNKLYLLGVCCRVKLKDRLRVPLCVCLRLCEPFLSPGLRRC